MTPKNVLVRVGGSVLAIVLFSAAFGCSVIQPTPPGREGEACSTGLLTSPTRCNGSNLTCVSSRCVAAGRDGQPCIQQLGFVPVPPMCDPGLVCDGSNVCRASCGGSGRACCPGAVSCGAGLTCNAGRCQPPAATTCQIAPGPGLQLFAVPLMDPGGCVGDPVGYATYAPTQSAANTCAANAYAARSLRVDDSTDPPVTRTFCFRELLGARRVSLSVRRDARWATCPAYHCNASNRCTFQRLESDTAPCE